MEGGRRRPPPHASRIHPKSSPPSGAAPRTCSPSSLDDDAYSLDATSTTAVTWGGGGGGGPPGAAGARRQGARAMGAPPRTRPHLFVHAHERAARGVRGKREQGGGALLERGDDRGRRLGHVVLALGKQGRRRVDAGGCRVGDDLQVVEVGHRGREEVGGVASASVGRSRRQRRHTVWRPPPSRPPRRPPGASGRFSAQSSGRPARPRERAARCRRPLRARCGLLPPPPAGASP